MVFVIGFVFLYESIDVFVGVVVYYVVGYYFVSVFVGFG